MEERVRPSPRALQKPEKRETAILLDGHLMKSLVSGEKLEATANLAAE